MDAEKLKKFMDSCPDQIMLEQPIVINWSLKGFGFGQVAFYNGKDGEIRCMNECMSAETVKKILNMMVDQSVMEDK